MLKCGVSGAFPAEARLEERARQRQGFVHEPAPHPRPRPRPRARSQILVKRSQSAPLRAKTHRREGERRRASPQSDSSSVHAPHVKPSLYKRLDSSASLSLFYHPPARKMNTHAMKEKTRVCVYLSSLCLFESSEHVRCVCEIVDMNGRPCPRG